MEGRRREQIFSTFPGFFPTTLRFGTDTREHFNSLREEQLKTDDYFKNGKKKSSNFQFWIDSDDEFKGELENAVKQYKKNKKNEPLEIELNLSDEGSNCESHKPKIVSDDINNDFKKKKSKENIICEVNSRENIQNDIQDLINYFFLEKKENSQSKSYVDYEKQGALPKNKLVRGEFREHNKNEFEAKNAQVVLKLKKNKSKKNEEKALKAFLNENQLEIKNSPEEYNFIRNSSTDEVIIKIKEENCSKPFFYIVPENPSPNFFLSRGSYYVIPKTPSSATKSRIFFHPEINTEWDVDGGNALSPKILDKEHDVIQDLQDLTNNLGKEVLQKLDSHLNIGPIDVKLGESNNNLETNYNLDKIFSKTLLTSNSPNASSRSQSESGLGLGMPILQKNAELDKLNFEEAVVNSDSLLKIERQNVNSREDFTSNAESFKLRQLDTALQMLMSEFPDLEADSAEIIADKYWLDEDGLKNYITSTHFKRKMQYQLERMILALPEHSYEELKDKCIEFQGNEELVSSYIEEVQKANKIRQQILDLQFVLPDADPEFSRQEIEKLNGDDGAFNILIDQLLDKKDYPKVREDPLNADRRRWWRELVEKFNVKNFVLKVPAPGDFVGTAGDNNKADLEIVLKFLQSRYPSKTRDILIQAFESNKRNVTKTCGSLNDQHIIRLSESSFRNEEFTEAFLEEVCYIDHKKEIDDYLAEMKERKEIEKEEARINQSFLMCPLCSEDELIVSEAFCCLEGHIFCKDCIKRYISVKIGEGVFRFLCPSENCGTFFSYKTLQEVLPENVLSNIIKKQQAEEIMKAEVEGLESCLYCEFAYIPKPEDKIFKCQNPTCLSETCRRCREKNHIPQRCEEIERSIDVEARKKIEESMTQELVRICPTCKKKFVKIDGCNKMVCVCGTTTCYICREQVTGYDHFRRKCPLYSNNSVLHTTKVFQAGIQTRDEILRENQDIRVLFDPTISKDYK